MGKFNYKTNCVAAASLLLSLFCSSCQDELLNSGSERVEEGLPATVTLRLSVGDMDVRTRTIAEEASANYCNNIWIGLYSKETGDLIDHYYTDEVQSVDEVAGREYEVSFTSKSHNDVYLVAVANSDVNSGIPDIDEYGTATEKTLRQQLDEATTLEKFEKICMLRPDKNDVNVYANTLTMSGWYATSSPGTKDASSMDAININKGANNLSGAIYLKRLIAYNKFIIVPGEYVNLTMQTWQVCNVPAGCYMFEQSGNVTDGKKIDGFYNNTLKSRLFTTSTNDEGKEEKIFEFYQVENKHQAIDYASDGTDHVGIDENVGAAKWYNEREREFKSGSLNTGVYRSLVAGTTGDLSNNNATYVVLTADVDYYVAAPEDITQYNPETAMPVDPSTPGAIHRTATVTYTIHLGYCEEKNGDDPTVNTARDFNCRRNTKYTYHVTINGVKNIVVEAVKKDGTEDQPGAEGWVSDETGRYQELDSHYCEFNISLTDAERNAMSYRITAPYGDKTYYYTRDKDGHVDKTEGMNEELYSWIKFYPTKDETTLAEFAGGKGRNTVDEDNGREKGDGLWTFNDMCSPSVKVNNYYAPDADGKRWYTVFVDEYVYHFDDQGGVESSWPNYVNKDDRIAEFMMNNDVSKDGESTYTYCKYVFGQKSIQTYYKNGAATAIGVEHEEETFGLNMNWRLLTNNRVGERNTEKYDLANGRYNLYYYLDTFDITKWSQVVQQKVPAHVKAGSNFGCSHPDADYPVYMPAPEGSKNSVNQATPGDGNAYRGNSICMNRNRDLNGNGIIEPNEIRWFTPTSSVYVQISTAQGELPDPILRYTDYSPDYFIPAWRGSYGYYDWYAERLGAFNFHYISSDFQYYWAEQAVTTGDYPMDSFNSGGETMTYTVRCVRNLGTDTKTTDPPVKGQREVGYAFEYDSNTRTFSQNYFMDETLRGYTMGGIAPHETSAATARPHKKFQVASDFVRNIKDDYVSFNPNGEMSYVTATNSYASNEAIHSCIEAWTKSLDKNTICGKYTQEGGADLGTWRVPTAYELGLMWIEGLPQKDGSFTFSSTQNYFIDYTQKDYTEYNRKYIGYNKEGDRMVLALDCYGKTPIRLRCVRDVR